VALDYFWGIGILSYLWQLVVVCVTLIALLGLIAVFAKDTWRPKQTKLLFGDVLFSLENKAVAIGIASNDHSEIGGLSGMVGAFNFGRRFIVEAGDQDSLVNFIKLWLCRRYGNWRNFESNWHVNLISVLRKQQFSERMRQEQWVSFFAFGFQAVIGKNVDNAMCDDTGSRVQIECRRMPDRLDLHANGYLCLILPCRKVR
jgi:hypothetical protein